MKLVRTGLAAVMAAAAITAAVAEPASATRTVNCDQAGAWWVIYSGVQHCYRDSGYMTVNIGNVWAVESGHNYGYQDTAQGSVWLDDYQRVAFSTEVRATGVEIDGR